MYIFAECRLAELQGDVAEHTTPFHAVVTNDVRMSVTFSQQRNFSVSKRKAFR